MNFRDRIERVRQLDPDTIPDHELRPTITVLLGILEECLGLVGGLQERVESLEAEVRRLKGLPPKPKFPGGKLDPAVVRPLEDHSFEAERREPKQRQKRSKRGELRSVCAVLARRCGDTEYDPAGFDGLLQRHLPRLGTEARKKVETAALIAGYRARQDGPVIRCLVCDDASTSPWVREELALCWVHDARHYQKLRPQFELYRGRLRRFRKRYWDYYRELGAYRKAPDPVTAERLRNQFDPLFATRTGYRELDVCIARTEANRDQLVLVLDHPELPLHNNAAELAARQRVRRRDVSFGPRTEGGRKAWDAFQSLLATAGQLGVRFWNYLWDRVTRAETVPRLAAVLTAKAAEGDYGASWGAPALAAA